jgi:hypothetical protein
MSQQSFVYRHIVIYRFIMNLLYLGKYKKRFVPVINLIKKLPAKSRVLELCFGDIVIAEFCRKENYIWKGIDLNSHFVAQAQGLGYDAVVADLTTVEALPKAEVCIMTGSLYHFHQNINTILKTMFTAADRVILSEPVFNLSSSGGLIGFFARRSANAGKGDEAFRYNTDSLLAALDKQRDTLNYQIVSTEHLGKDLIVKLSKNGIN